jgi:hypothetical protein
VKEDGMSEACSTYGMDKKCVKNVGKPEGKRLVGKLRRIWEDNIRMDLREIRWECVNWMHLSEDRNQWLALVKSVMKAASFLD